MPLTVTCTNCGAQGQATESAAGKRIQCRSCGQVIDVSGPVRKICVICGADLAGQKRVKDEVGRYYCHPCWAQQGQETAAGAEVLGSLAELGEPAPADEEIGMADHSGEAYCRLCKLPARTQDMYFFGARPICKRCCHGAIQKWALRLFSVAAVAGIVWVIGWVAIPRAREYIQARAERSAPPEPKNRSARVIVRQPEPEDAGPSAEELETELARNFQQAAEAGSAGRRDFVTLLELRRQRQEFIKGAPAGVSRLIDEWREDAQVIGEARGLVAQMRYGDAVRRLQQRMAARYAGPGSAGDGAGRGAGGGVEVMNGDLGVALVEASLAAAVVDDQWVMERGEMLEMLQRVAERDPANARASVMQAWLARPEVSEELLRLDARASVIQRNRLLAPIRSSMVSRVVSYEGELSFEAFQEKLEQGIGPAAMGPFREVMAPLDFSLGMSRKRMEEELDSWLELLEAPEFVLKDRANSTYRLIRGYLWKQVPLSGRGYEWHMMLPPVAGMRLNEARWTPWKLRLVRWLAPEAEAPEELREVLAQLDRSRPLPGGFPKVGGYSLAAYDPGDVSPRQLLELKVPVAFTTLDVIRGGWVGSARLERGFQGKALLLDPRIAQDFAGGGWSGGVQVVNNAPMLAVGLQPLMAVVERQDPVTLSLFSSEEGGAYFVSSAGRPVFMKPGYVLGMGAPGGGSVTIPLCGSHFNTPAMRAAVSRLLRQMQEEPQCEALQELRAQVRQYGDLSQKSLDALVVDAIAPPPSAVMGATVIRPSPAVSEPWWFVLMKHADAVQRSRQLFAMHPHGQIRNRLVRARVAAAEPGATLGQSGPVPRELQFLDENGDAVAQFYGRAELEKLVGDAVRDFIRPSARLVPSPLVAEVTGEVDERLQGFMLAQAGEAKEKGELHLAAALYREVGMPALGIERFDSTRPRSREEFEAMVRQMGRWATFGLARLEARLGHAEVLRLGGRSALGDAVEQAARAEWVLSGIPLLESLRRYTEAYGYAASEEFNAAYLDIRSKVTGAGLDRAPAARASGGAAFDPERAKAEGEAYLERFYDGRPSLEEYVEAKRWALQADGRLVMRRPRTEAAGCVLFWSPVSWKEDAESGGPGRSPLRPLSMEEICGAESRENEVARRWLEIVHEVETGEAADRLRARGLLLALAASERGKTREGELTSRESLAHALNAVAAMSLASVLDAELPEGFGSARLDPMVLELAELEIEALVRPRLGAGGNAGAADELVDPLLDLIRHARRAARRYGESRYFWAEYGPLVDGYRKFLTPEN